MKNNDLTVPQSPIGLTILRKPVSHPLSALYVSGQCQPTSTKYGPCVNGLMAMPLLLSDFQYNLPVLITPTPSAHLPPPTCLKCTELQYQSLAQTTHLTGSEKLVKMTVLLSRHFLNTLRTKQIISTCDICFVLPWLTMWCYSNTFCLHLLFTLICNMDMFVYRRLV